MITAMIISFRECLEMLLIIVPLLVYLKKIDNLNLSKFVYAGTLIGAISSVILGIVLVKQVNFLDGYSQKLFLGCMMLFLSALILYSIIWVGKQNKIETLNITDKYDIKLTGISLFLLSFITIFRESIEIILFILPKINEGMLTINIGISLGVLISLILSYVLFKTTIKLNLSIVFSFLTILLIVIGGGMFGEGLVAIFPTLGKSIETAGRLIYCIPLLYIFIKKELRKYLKK